jgi:acyl-CoA synthetase (NDP forming)
MARDLKPFFAPESVAILGASERPTSSGGAVLQMLRKSGYPGRIAPVNPKGGSAFGLAMHPNLRDIGAPCELCVVVIRPEQILDAMREAISTGHRNFLVLPGGFAEAGEAGRTRDAELRQLIAQHDLTVAGPNCAGIIHLRQEMRFGATFLRDLPPGGGVALISQSGAIAEEAVAAANRMPLALGTVVSVGNATQLGVEDYLEYLGTDARCRAVLLYIESLEDPDRFRRAARKVAAEKPVVLLMGGATPPGARAASAHTGAIANTDQAISAFAAECCMIRVRSLRGLLLAAKGFGFFPQGMGKRVLILSNSGGPGVIASDCADREGLELVELPEAMASELRGNFPPEASVANPLDLLADAREDRFGFTLESAIRHGTGHFDAILGMHVVPFMVDPAPVIARLAALASQVSVPFMHSMMGTLPGSAEWFVTMEKAGVPMFRDVEEMGECAGLLAQYPALKAAAAGPLPNTPPALRGRR